MTNRNKIKINKSDYYTIRLINKRVICIPSESLKKKQRLFLNILKKEYPLKTSTLETAEVHKGKKWILKTDVKDFFNSVPFDDIQEILLNALKKINKESELVNYLILTTINNKLPTGAPTSPYIANACFLKIDKILGNLCYLYKVNYSRYADDLIFSSDYLESLNIVEKRIRTVLAGYGYKINNKKTKYISDNKQQNILGLVVNNNKLRLSGDFKRKIRAMFHSYYISICKTAQTPLKYHCWDTRRFQSLIGYINYIKHVDKKFYLKLIEYQNKMLKKVTHSPFNP